MIDLTQLLTFFHVAQTMSFSKAAVHLNLAQPTVSRHIKCLEEDLGVQLFVRSHKHLKLTEEGQLLLPRAGKLLREVFEIQELMESTESHIVGHLRIACGTTTGKYITPQFAGRFHRRNPHVDISISKCDASQVVPYLLSEQADIGVISYDVSGEDMECQEFFDDHIILVAPVGHPWESRPYIYPSELLEEPMIIREPQSGTRHALLTELGKHGLTLDNLNIFLEIGNSEAIVKVVEARYGVAFVSRIAAEWALGKGVIIEVPVADFDVHRTIYMLKPQVHETNRAIEAYWSFVHDPSNADLLCLAEQ